MQKNTYISFLRAIEIYIEVKHNPAGHDGHNQFIVIMVQSLPPALVEVHINIFNGYRELHTKMRVTYKS